MAWHPAGGLDGHELHEVGDGNNGPLACLQLALHVRDRGARGGGDGSTLMDRASRRGAPCISLRFKRHNIPRRSGITSVALRARRASWCRSRADRPRVRATGRCIFVAI